jgi:serine/threonine-protein kinase
MNEESLFHQALARPAAERAAFFDAACGDDDALRQRLQVLLHAHENPCSFLESPARTVDTQVSERPGTVIGPYKLMEQIGEGGMGLVFVAEQQAPVRRKVALKVIKPGMDTRQVIARFEAERQALTLMDHPNIAKVLDGGETGSGRPYFVMELVKGVPITEYCDQNQVPVRERLELFLSVCQAVQHAHQKGIIHRDIKPSNVLVMSQDGTPLVKVIDFGVAKAVGQHLTDKTIYTQFTQLVGTPLYMSPEQAGQSGLDVDTRTDIYALGVLLYELLTGTTPFDKDRIKEAGYDEIRRIIREEEPPRPSTRISTLAQAATTIATQRKSDPKRLSQLMRGELDWIVMKALEKDRNRRYETASTFAADVQRYLADEPVQACPASAWYRFRKFTRRKKTALVVAACVFLAVAGITGGVGWALRDRAARDDEQRARDEALDKAVQAALTETELLIGEQRWTEALAVVNRADKLMESAGRAERPPLLLELRTDLMMAERLDDIYQEPKQNRKVHAMLLVGEGSGHSLRPMEEGVSEEEFFWGREQDRRYAQAFRKFGIDMETLAPAEAAARLGRTHIRQALVQALDKWGAMRKRAHGGTEDSLWKKLMEVARQADPDRRRNQFREALFRRDRPALEQLANAVPIRDVPPATVYLLGLALRDLGALEKAIAVLAEAQRHHPGDFWLNDALGWFSWEASPPRYQEALRYYQAALAVRPHSARAHVCLGGTLKKTNRLDQALAEYSKAIELDPKNAVAWNNRGLTYEKLHQYDKALADYSKAIELEPKNARRWNNRGFTYGELHQYDKALADLNKAIELDPKDAVAWRNRGAIYSELHQYNKALAQYNKALAHFSKAIELEPMHVNFCWRGSTYNELRQYDKAVADLTKAIELDPKCVSAWTNRAHAYKHLQQYDKALADFNKAIELDPKVAVYWNNRGWTYNKLHQYDKALADFTKAVELDPKDALAWNNRGCAFTGLHQYDKAIAAFSKAIELNPKYVIAWYNRGRIYKDAHQCDKAVADNTKAIELDPKLAGAWINRGSAYNKLHQYDKALADLNKAIELDPKLAVAWLNRGFAYNELHQYDKALADYTKAIELDPKLRGAWNNRACAYHELHQYDKEIADWDRVIELDAKDAGTWNARGFAYHHLQQPDKAIADLTKAIELDPKYALAWSNRGWVYAGLHQYHKAVPDLDKAIELDPRNAPAWINRAFAHMRLHQYDKALADLNQAIELEPKNGAAWYNRGYVFADLGEWDKAITDFSKCIEVDPQDPLHWYARALARLHHGDRAAYRKDCAGMLEHFGPTPSPEAAYWTVWTSIQVPDGVEDWTRLLQWAEKSLAADANRLERLTALGAVLYRAGRFEAAGRRLAQADAAFLKAKDPVSTIAYTWLFLAMAHERLGHAEQARKWLAKAVREIEQPPAERAKDPGARSWNRKLTLQLLRGQAESLLRMKGEKTQHQDTKKKP